MTIVLRNYQLEAVQAVISAANVGIFRQLISLPTGSGKTIIMSALAKELNKRTLILAHRQELIVQTVDKLKLAWPEVSIGVCQGNQDEIHNHVVVGSVQSCSQPKRLEKLRKQGFELLMIDEAHHSVSESYQNVINGLGFSGVNNRLLLGVTATPQRSDKLGLGETFTHITFSRSISTMIKGGYLSPIVGRKILTNFSFEKIRSSNGDFAISDLSELVNTPERNVFIVSKFKEYAPERKGIAFCCDVQHCKDLSNAFKASGIESAPVWGDMEPIERKRALEAFKHGQIQIITSCGILTEGYDEPTVNAIIMARPTKSSGLFTQCIGRGLRLWPGKENCLVLDFTDKHHTLDGIMSLNNAIPEITTIEDRPKIEREETDCLPKIEIWEECDRLFDILGSSRFIWVQVDDEWSLQDDDKNEIVMRPSYDGYIADLHFLDGSSSQIVNSPLPLEYCSGVCEDYARRNLKISFANAKAPWMLTDSPPTKGQRDYLEKKGAYSEGMTRGQASIEIRKIVASKNKERRAMANEVITIKQKYFLQNHGIAVASDMTKLQAMQEIYRIKNETAAGRNFRTF